MIFTGSRLEGCKLSYDDSNEMNYIAYMDMQVPTGENDLVYKVKVGDRLDILAQRFYNDPQKGWVILQANPEYTNEYEIKAGETLIIPKNSKEVDYSNVNVLG